MAKTNCMYCAAEMSDDELKCPACGAPSHHHAAGKSSQNIKKFLFLFVVLVVLSAFFMLWLPR